MSYHEDIYERVNKIVKKYHTRCPKTIIDNMNIMITTTATTKLLGMYTIFKRKRVIFISDSLDYLTNVVLAHELGHDQLHRQECTKGKAFHEETIPTSTGKFELEANIFAAHLLIDDDKLKTLLLENRPLKEIAYEFMVTEELVSLKIRELIILNLLDLELWKLNNSSSDFLKNYCPDALTKY